MKAKIVLVILALGGALVVAIPALAAPDRTVKVDGTVTIAKWDGTPATAANQSFTLEPEVPIGVCGKLAINYCEDTVINAAVAASANAKLKITLDGFAAVMPPPPSPTSLFDDFDLFVYKSDAAGKLGELVVAGGEGAGTPEVVTIANASGFYLVRVVYYATLQAGYKGTAELIGAPRPAGVPTVIPGTSPTATPAPGTKPSPSPTPPAISTGKPGILPASGPLAVSFAADKGKRKTARKRGMRVRLRCSVQCKTTVTATIDKKVARALKLGKKKLKIGIGRATITRPGRIPFFVKLSKKAKKALARRQVKKFKVKLAFVVTDTSGGQLKKGTKTITLR